MKIPEKNWWIAKLKGFFLSVARFAFALVVFAVLYLVIGGGLAWVFPYTLIILTFIAMVWYFVRTGEWIHFGLRILCVFATGLAVIALTANHTPTWMWGGWAGVITLTVLAVLWYFIRRGVWKHFSLRSLFVLTTGLAMIITTATWVPMTTGFLHMSLGGGWWSVNTEQIAIEVVDKTTKLPISNAEVVLTSHTQKPRRDKETTKQQGTANASGVAEFQCECTQSTRWAILRNWTVYKTGDWSLETKAPGYQPTSNILRNVIVIGEGSHPLNFHIMIRRENQPIKFRIELRANPQ